MSIDCALFATITRDGEVKTSKNNKTYVRFGCRAGDGDHAQFASVMYFGTDIQELAPKLQKGVRVYVEGNVRLDKWDKDGVPQSGLGIMSFYCRIAEIGRHKPRRPDDRSDESPDMPF